MGKFTLPKVGSITLSLTHAFYFQSFEQRPRDLSGDFWLQCFLRKEVLDGRWPAVLERYFRDHERRDLWRRLVGMWRYEGYWEYKLVGFVSLQTAEAGPL